MVDDPKPIAKRMQDALERYHGLRQHDPEQSDFKRKVLQLQTWQSERVLKTHADLIANQETHNATLFLVKEIYAGIDLKILSAQIQRAINAALRILPERVMETSMLALELNALTAELDDQLAHWLFDTMGVDDITDETYIEAFRCSADKSLRHQQAALTKQVAVGLDKYVRSRLLYGTFKLVKRPAHKAGIAELYDFMGRGFAVMRPLGSVSVIIDQVVDKEVTIINRIYKDDAAPFDFSSC